ncbi:hypothetical protein BTGOE4_36240 [Bacillus thuringiensis]|uniref:Uncharacterized protein n=1 Tax=Bacillus thuringiensis TaxID=1428 RepID=A0A9X5N7J6_BACTU|nr:hypothetical protein BTGOE4_36240 [Bacillus thuringiensis]
MFSFQFSLLFKNDLVKKSYILSFVINTVILKINSFLFKWVAIKKYSIHFSVQARRLICCTYRSFFTTIINDYDCIIFFNFRRSKSYLSFSFSYKFQIWSYFTSTRAWLASRLNPSGYLLVSFAMFI